MNPSNIEKLQQEQEKGIASCRLRIEQWKKFRLDYEELKKTISTLPGKITHDIMVPFGSLALMPGKLVHTNEILVLLGDNWFTERSSEQALEIVDRRIAQCDEMLRKFQEEENQFAHWIDYTTEVKREASEFVEIIEEYDEDKEKLWREQHRKNLRKSRETAKKKVESDVDLEELFSRLEANESIDEDNDDIASSADDPSDRQSSSKRSAELWSEPERGTKNTSLTVAKTAGPSGDVGASHDRGRRVSWQADPVIRIEEEGINESQEIPPPLRIYITHTQEPKTSDDDNDDGDASPASGKAQVINSPADIYIHFSSWLKKIPKSILKPSPPSPVKGSDLETPLASELASVPTRKQDIPHSTTPSTSAHVPVHEALSDVVVERASSEVQAPSASRRPTSRFKAQKQAASHS